MANAEKKKKGGKLKILILALTITVLFLLIAPLLSKILLGTSDPEQLNSILGQSVLSIDVFKKMFKINLIIATPIYLLVALLVIPRWILNADVFTDYKSQKNIDNKELVALYVKYNKEKKFMPDFPTNRKKAYKLLFWTTREGKILCFLLIFLLDNFLGLLPSLT